MKAFNKPGRKPADKSSKAKHQSDLTSVSAPKAPIKKSKRRLLMVVVGAVLVLAIFGAVAYVRFSKPKPVVKTPPPPPYSNPTQKAAMDALIQQPVQKAATTKPGELPSETSATKVSAGGQ